MCACCYMIAGKIFPIFPQWSCIRFICLTFLGGIAAQMLHSMRDQVLALATSVAHCQAQAGFPSSFEGGKVDFAEKLIIVQKMKKKNPFTHNSKWIALICRFIYTLCCPKRFTKLHSHTFFENRVYTDAATSIL